MMSSPLRIIFMGTPDFAVPTLRALHQAGHTIAAVYTRAPKPKGRGQQVTVSPVHQYALDHGLGPIMTPASFRRDAAAVDEFLNIPCDVVVVAAYGLILPPRILNAPRYGCLNVHGSLLPRWRGAAPIHHAIWAGDTQTGITIMQMDAGLDTGDMIVAETIPITTTTITPMLHDQLSELGAKLMADVVHDLARDKIVPRTPQPNTGVTIAPMLKKEDGQIDWQNGADVIDRQVRALQPWPGTTAGLFKILAVAGPGPRSGHEPPGTLMDRDGWVRCGAGTALRVVMIQTPTGKKMTITDAVNGGIVRVGDVLR